MNKIPRMQCCQCEFEGGGGYNWGHVGQNLGEGHVGTTRITWGSRGGHVRRVLWVLWGSRGGVTWGVSYGGCGGVTWESRGEGPVGVTWGSHVGRALGGCGGHVGESRGEGLMGVVGVTWDLVGWVMWELRGSRVVNLGVTWGRSHGGVTLGRWGYKGHVGGHVGAGHMCGYEGGVAAGVMKGQVT